MSGKKGLITEVLGLALIAVGIFISVISFGVALPGGLTLISTGLTLIQGVRAAKSLEQTGALQRSTPQADPSTLGAFVFGTTIVPMNLVYEEIRGSDPDRVLHDVYAHAWHRIESYVSLTVATDAGPEVVSFSGTAATGAYSNLLWWFTADGTQSAALSGSQFDNNSWPSTAVFAGVAHSGLVWNIDDDAFRAKFSSIPTKLEVKVEGAWLYDPRLDPTYGSGSQDYGTPSSWGFNDGNAALVLLRGIIGEYAGSDLVWGRGAPETEINMASFITAANVADESLDGAVRYRLGGMWLLSGSFEEFVAQWEQETGGKLSKSGGQYTVWLPNDDLTPLTTITESDVVQGAAIQHTIAGGLENLYNCARGRYIDAANGYVGKPYAEVTEDAEITADGGKRPLPQDFSWVQSESIAQRTARIRVRRSRFQRVWIVPMGWKGQGPNYAVFSVHTLNCKETNYSDQTVRVIDRKMSYMGLTVLTLQQEDSSIYDDTVALEDPLAGNNVNSKTSVFGTVLPVDINDSWTPVVTNVLQRGKRFTKLNADGWDAEVRSLQGFVGCAVSFRAGQTNKKVMVALNSDPTTDANYTSLDYALFPNDDGNLYIYESGSVVGSSLGSYSTSDVLTIAYDGVWVKYYKNGTVLRVVPRIGAVLYLDSSFYGSGAFVTDLTFGQITKNEVLARAWVADSQGKPAGIRCGHSSTGTATRTPLSIVAGALQIASLTTESYEFCFPAIPVNPAKTYQLTIRHGATVASSDGRYFRFSEYSSDLPSGKTHIGHSSAVYESMFVSVTSSTDAANNASMSTTIVTETFRYTPTAGTKHMSFSLWNETPTADTSLLVEWCALTELGSNVDMLPGVQPPIETFGINPDAATGIYAAFTATDFAQGFTATPYTSLRIFIVQNGARTYGSSQKLRTGTADSPLAISDQFSPVSGYAITVGINAVWASGNDDFGLTLTSVPAPVDDSYNLVVTVTADYAIGDFNSGLGWWAHMSNENMQAIVIKR